MEPARDPALRPLAVVLGGGVIAGAIAGLAAGAIDAVWSWGPAAQFVPGLGGRLRFVVFSGVTDAAAGALAGLVLTATLLVLSRGSRLGDLLRFAWGSHQERRDVSPRPIAALAIALAAMTRPEGLLVAGVLGLVQLSTIVSTYHAYRKWPSRAVDLILSLIHI